MDLRKQKAFQLLKNGAIRKLEDGFAVRSQSSKRFYFVNHEYRCNCPDCQFNGTEVCKHSYAVKYYLGIEKANGTTTKIRLTYPQAWKAYNQAQQSEVKLFDELLKDLVADVETEQYVFGRPQLDKKEVMFCAIQKVYSQLSSRRAKSLFNKSVEAEQLKHSPNFNAVSNLLKKESTTPLLQDLLLKTAQPLKAVESKFAIDSSGFRTTKFNEYCNEKHNDKKRHHEWIKAHICVGTKTNVITGAVITRGNGKGTGDITQFSDLVEQTSQNFEAQEYSADMAYNSIGNYNLIHEKGAKAYIPFKSNITATVRSGNRGKLWRKMFHYFSLNQEEFSSHYHNRSNAETAFHMIKSKLGDSVKSKNQTAQKNELLCKLVAHNIIVLIHEMHELGIEAKFS